MALALALTLAAVARADNAVLEARSPKRTTPALDARVDGIRSALAPARAATPKPAPARAPNPAAVKSGAASTAPAVAKADKPAAADRPALVSREASKDKTAARDPRSEKSVIAAKDAKKPGALDDDGRDVLGDLGRELRDLGRWLTEQNWE
jgi:hypothetical protein